MKTESNIKPSAVIVEEHGDKAEVIFRENITEETREQDGQNAGSQAGTNTQQEGFVPVDDDDLPF